MFNRCLIPVALKLELRSCTFLSLLSFKMPCSFCGLLIDSNDFDRCCYERWGSGVMFRRADDVYFVISDSNTAGITSLYDAPNGATCFTQCGATCFTTQRSHVLHPLRSHVLHNPAEPRASPTAEPRASQPNGATCFTHCGATCFTTQRSHVLPPQAEPRAPLE